MALHRGYEKATRCTDGPTPGAKALMAWFLGVYGGRGGKNLGVFVCRSVRGGTTTSLHGEGRACDFGINPHGAAWGTALADQLRLHSAEIGVQCVIWNRRIWSGSYPDAGWRRYSGVNAHVDHIHLELTRAAAAALTSARVAQILTATSTSEEDDMTPEQDQLLRAVFQQLAGPGASPAKFTGWPGWGGGTGETLTMVDLARRSNVETRVLRNEHNAAVAQLRAEVNALSKQVGELVAAVRAGGGPLPATTGPVEMTGTFTARSA